jgi:predicted aconitase with swiveling domain
MGLGTSATAMLGKAARAMEGRLGNLGMLRPAVGEETQAILRNAVPSAIMTTGFNILGGVDPMTSVVAGAADLGINVGGMKLAGRYAPGTMGKLSYTDNKGKTLTRNEYVPSGPQNIVQGLAPVAASMAVMPLIQNQMQQQQQKEMDQTVSLQQQAMQRQLINGDLTQALSPGTQFQLQGMEQTLNPESLKQNMADPYGYGRGLI